MGCLHILLVLSMIATHMMNSLLAYKFRLPEPEQPDLGERWASIRIGGTPYTFCNNSIWFSSSNAYRNAIGILDRTTGLCSLITPGELTLRHSVLVFEEDEYVYFRPGARKNGSSKWFPPPNAIPCQDYGVPPGYCYLGKTTFNNGENPNCEETLGTIDLNVQYITILGNKTCPTFLFLTTKRAKDNH